MVHITIIGDGPSVCLLDFRIKKSRQKIPGLPRIEMRTDPFSPFTCAPIGIYYMHTCDHLDWYKILMRNCVILFGLETTPDGIYLKD